MKERGILFSSAMVRAILDGRKTQTRRVVRELPGGRGGLVGDHVKWFERGQQDATRWCGHDGLGSLGWVTCPYGEPGDRLWVRETWSRDALTVYPCPPVWYRADVGSYDDPASGEHTRHCDALRTGHPRADCFACAGPFRWRPSIFMPRKLSRITLEIAEVRVQRLQEISEDDASSEGDGPRVTQRRVYPSKHAAVVEYASYRDAFADLWDALNGKRAPWSSNPWVWVLAFRRIP